MSKIYPSAQPPIGMPVEADIYHEGEVLKASTTPGRLAKSGTKGDVIIGIVDQDTLTAKGDAKTVAAGFKLGVWRLGSGGDRVIWVKSIAGQTYGPNAKIYASDTPGQVTATPDTSRPVGTYPEWMTAQTTAVAGELIPCVLDVPVGAATVAGG